MSRTQGGTSTDPVERAAKPWPTLAALVIALGAGLSAPAGAATTTALGLAGVIYSEEGALPAIELQWAARSGAGPVLIVDTNVSLFVNTLDIAVGLPIGRSLRVTPRVGPTVYAGWGGGSLGLDVGLHVAKSVAADRALALDVAWRTFREDARDSAIPITSVGLVYEWSDR